uniref:Uncharacterized protein n=1 Tax=Glossina austeni TaxID=7395 RepID=A0A1A9VT69_GLOAU
MVMLSTAWRPSLPQLKKLKVEEKQSRAEEEEEQQQRTTYVAVLTYIEAHIHLSKASKYHQQRVNQHPYYCNDIVVYNSINGNIRIIVYMLRPYSGCATTTTTTILPSHREFCSAKSYKTIESCYDYLLELSLLKLDQNPLMPD